MVMAWPTMVTTVMLTLMLTDTTTARGLLMLSPRLMPTMAIMDTAWPITGTVMAWPTTVTMVLMLTLMLTDTTTARGLLMLSPRLMPTMVIIMDTDSPTMGTVMPIMVTTATLTLIMATTDIITKLFCYFVQ